MLGPAQANLATEALGAKAALGIFVVLEILGLFLILGIPRLINAWRSASSSAAGPPRLEAVARVQSRPKAEPAALADDGEIAESAKLGMSHGGDG